MEWDLKFNSEAQERSGEEEGGENEVTTDFTLVGGCGGWGLPRTVFFLVVLVSPL